LKRKSVGFSGFVRIFSGFFDEAYGIFGFLKIHGFFSGFSGFFSGFLKRKSVGFSGFVRIFSGFFDEVYGIFGVKCPSNICPRNYRYSGPSARVRIVFVRI
jgi:hypothetical protein